MLRCLAQLSIPSFKAQYLSSRPDFPIHSIKLLQRMRYRISISILSSLTEQQQQHQSIHPHVTEYPAGLVQSSPSSNMPEAPKHGQDAGDKDGRTVQIGPDGKTENPAQALERLPSMPVGAPLANPHDDQSARRGADSGTEMTQHEGGKRATHVQQAEPHGKELGKGTPAVRLDMDLHIDLDLHAKIKGDVTLSLPR